MRTSFKSVIKNFKELTIYSLLFIYLADLPINNAQAQTMKDAWNSFTSGKNSELLVRCGKNYIKIKSGIFFDSVYMLRDEEFINIKLNNFTDTSVHLSIEYEIGTKELPYFEFDLLVDGAAAFFNTAEVKARKIGKTIYMYENAFPFGILSYNRDLFETVTSDIFLGPVTTNKYKNITDYTLRNETLPFTIKYEINFFDGYLSKTYQRYPSKNTFDIIFVYFTNYPAESALNAGDIWDAVGADISDLISIRVPKDYPKVFCFVEFAK